MNEFEKTTGEIDNILTDYKDMMKKVQETLKDKMKDVFKSFFDSYPEVKTIHWTQYAPYFNDGDECVFSVHEPHFTRTEYTELEDREHSWGEGDDGIVELSVWDEVEDCYVDAYIDPNLIRDMNAFSMILQSDANEDIMRSMFGDHVWVKAHRGGFQIDDYDHD